MGQQLAVAGVERLVVDQQPDDLAVGDVDDGLAVLGVSETRFGVGQRTDLVEAVQVGARQTVRFAFVEVPAESDVTVGQREQRLALRQQVVMQFGLAHLPGLDGERLVLDHHDVSNSPRSVTTMSAPLSRNASA